MMMMMKHVQDYLVAEAALSKAQNPTSHFTEIYNATASVLEKDAAALFFFSFGPEDTQLVARCHGDTITWYDPVKRYSDKSPVWTRVDYIWGKATNNIAWYHGAEMETTVSRLTLWLCIGLAQNVWQGGSVEIHYF